MRCILLYLSTLCVVAGCTRVEVHKNPRPCDGGFRYYRPKPYLFITPGAGGPSSTVFGIDQYKPLEIKTSALNRNEPGIALASGFFPPSGNPLEPETGGEDQLDQPGQPIKVEPPKFISIKLVYMPDFSEEYAVDLRPGLGVGELNLELEDGWNLVSLSVKTDQQTDEIISSVADVAGAAAQFGERATGEQLAQEIYATNVPFGFYESVIATDPCGVKQLFGWRYVGFMPFQSCPGALPQCLPESDFDTVYGLVWIDGILQFRPIAEIPRRSRVSHVKP